MALNGFVDFVTKSHPVFSSLSFYFHSFFISLLTLSLSISVSVSQISNIFLRKPSLFSLQIPSFNYPLSFFPLYLLCHSLFSHSPIFASSLCLCLSVCLTVCPFILINYPLSFFPLYLLCHSLFSHSPIFASSLCLCLSVCLTVCPYLPDCLSFSGKQHLFFKETISTQIPSFNSPLSFPLFSVPLFPCPLPFLSLSFLCLPHVLLFFHLPRSLLPLFLYLSLYFLLHILSFLSVSSLSVSLFSYSLLSSSSLSLSLSGFSFLPSLSVSNPYLSLL